jgi:predicted ATPase/class 3 adenylate cyclase/Flp pilus assembly protein TadD
MSESRTLAITDIIDSTRLNSELGDAAMARLWFAHDNAARALMRLWRGQEVARSDGFLILFGTVKDAVEFSLAYHDALRLLDLRLKARVGIHIGPVELRENSAADRSLGAPHVEVDGVALPVVARVMAIALGGQTLLTGSAVQALEASPARAFRSHGHWRLKGIPAPVEIFEIGERGGLFEPPPDSAKAYRVVKPNDDWVPARKIPNNLPAQRDEFVGRKGALQELAALMEGETRLVTLLGIGGIGKTRLALRHASTWLGDYPGGAWFCDLSTARGIDGIVYSVAQALAVPLGKSDPVEQIASAIAARGPCLLLLDTFEQVARHAEATLGVWLSQAAESKFIVTSREVLGIVGEKAQVLAPMADDEAAALFIHRSGSVGKRFATGGRDSAAISSLVKLLDGLPLAIELAAARTRVMSPRSLLDRMSERFTLLAARGGRLDRQVTLRAALDWSWDLLTAKERAALAQLSVFRGGFSLEAVEAVISSDNDPPLIPPMDLLQSLLDKSFVRQTGDYRFDLLQSVQEYAAEHLRYEGRFEGSGPSSALAAEIRHGSFFGAMEEAEATSPTCFEVDNLVEACRRAVARADSMTATRTVRLVWAVLELRGPIKAGLELADAVLSVAGLAIPMVAEVLLIKGRALRTLGRIPESITCFNDALAGAQSIGDRRLEAKALGNLGRPSSDRIRMTEAWQQVARGLELAREIHDERIECELLNALGTLNDYAGRNSDARTSYEQALSLARAARNRRWVGGILGNLGNIFYKQGRVSQARSAYEQGIELARELGNRTWEGNMLCNLGLLRHVEGRSAEALELLERSLQTSRQIGQARLEVTALCNLGIVEEAGGKLVDATTHLSNASVVAEALGDSRAQGQALGYLGLVQGRQGLWQEAQRSLQVGEKLLGVSDDDPDLGVLYCCRAMAFGHVGDSAAAAKELDLAEAIKNRLGDSAGLDLVLALQRTRSIVAKVRD